MAKVVKTMPVPYIGPDGSVDEGLIRSAPPENLEGYLNRWCLDQQNGEIARTSITASKYVTLDLVMPKTKEKIAHMLQCAGAFGYYPAEWLGRKWDKNSLSVITWIGSGIVTIKLEAKYDIELASQPKVGYHATTTQKWAKIKRIGLVPKSYSKKTDHPERVYFAVQASFAEDISSNLFGDTPSVIIAADFKGMTGIRFFSDPNFYGYGFYCMVNIPPDRLRLVAQN